MYEIIDKTLKIASCGISDLTFEQASLFLSQWEDGAPLGSLTLFINPETGYLVLNKDHDNYEMNLKFATAYLSASDEQVNKFNNKLGDRLSETIMVMSKFRGYRRIQEELEIIDHQSLGQVGDYITKNVLMSLAGQEMSVNLMLAQAYSYGLINGKRMERSKRKAGAAV